MIVGLAGKSGVGKDTAARQLIMCQKWIHFAFANVLKETLMVLFQLTPNQVYGSEKEIVDPRWNKTPRELMQWIGTDVLRNQFNKDFFIIHARITLTQYLATPGVVGIIITDVRFDNEVDLIHELGGRVVQVLRPSLTQASTHESETGVDAAKIDGILVNASTVDILHNNLHSLINTFYL